MITPLDIENKKFSKQMMNGYSVEEVDDFLDEVHESYIKNYKEVSELNKKIEEYLKEIDELNSKLEHYKNIESTLQNTLLVAQSTAEGVKDVANKQADQIIKNANQQAEEIIRNARGEGKREAEQLGQEIISKQKSFDDLQKQFDIYKAKMESLLISQLELIKEINKSDI